jgi:hypothetical protein
MVNIDIVKTIVSRFGRREGSPLTATSDLTFHNPLC